MSSIFCETDVAWSPVPAPVRVDRHAETLSALRNLLFSDDRPKWFKTVDGLLLSYLILRMADDHEIFDSQHTLAMRFGCDKRTISASIERLKNHGWISSRRRRYASSALSVNLDALPQSTPRLPPSEEAKELAKQVVEALKTVRPKRRYTQAAVDREVINAARIIESCGGNVEEAFEVVNFGLTSDKWRKRALGGLYFVNMNCSKIRADYLSQEGQKSCEQQ